MRGVKYNGWEKAVVVAVSGWRQRMVSGAAPQFPLARNLRCSLLHRAFVKPACTLPVSSIFTQNTSLLPAGWRDIGPYYLCSLVSRQSDTRNSNINYNRSKSIIGFITGHWITGN